jgi:hypothetical protein
VTRMGRFVNNDCEAVGWLFGPLVIMGVSLAGG